MAGVVNRYPQGLLGLLALQSGGDAPHGIGDDATVAIEAFDLYCNPQVLWMIGSAAENTNPGSSANFLIGGASVGPLTGEVWYVRRASFGKAQVNTAGTSKHYAIIANAGSAAPNYTILTTRTDDSTTEWQVSVKENFWMVPGQTLALLCVQYSDSAPKTYYASMDVCKFRY